MLVLSTKELTVSTFVTTGVLVVLGVVELRILVPEAAGWDTVMLPGNSVSVAVSEGVSDPVRVSVDVGSGSVISVLVGTTKDSGVVASIGVVSISLEESVGVTGVAELVTDVTGVATSVEEVVSNSVALDKVGDTGTVGVASGLVGVSGVELSSPA